MRTLLLALAVPIALHAQSKFEVASIRPCGPAPAGARARGGLSVSPGRLHVTCLPLYNIATIAYGVDLRFPLEEKGPAWIKSDAYDVEAKANGIPSAQAMQGPMLQALLEDRFKLKIRRETREVPVYALTVAKSGFKLQPLKEGSCTPFDPLTPPTDLTPSGITARIASTCANASTIGLRRKGPGGPVSAEYHGIMLDDFAKALDRAMDRSIVNKTGIAGMFDIRMEFAPDDATPAFMPGGRLLGYGGPVNPPVDAEPVGGPSIFTAIQEQLGLKLEPAKGPGEFFALVSVERPTEN